MERSSADAKERSPVQSPCRVVTSVTHDSQSRSPLSRSSGNKCLQQAAQCGKIPRSIAIEVIYEQLRSLVKGQNGRKNESKGSIKVNSNHRCWRNETAEINHSIANDNSRKLSR